MDGLQELIRKRSIGSPEAERLILASILAKENVALLGRLHKRSFGEPDCRAVFTELTDMVAAGEEFCHLAIIRWLSNPACKKRLRGLFYENNHNAWLAELATEFVTSAHDDYYIKVLSRERARRALFFLGVNLIEMNDQQRRDPMETAEWARTRAQDLYATFSQDGDEIPKPQASGTNGKLPARTPAIPQ